MAVRPRVPFALEFSSILPLFLSPTDADRRMELSPSSLSPSSLSHVLSARLAQQSFFLPAPCQSGPALLFRSRAAVALLLIPTISTSVGLEILAPARLPYIMHVPRIVCCLFDSDRKDIMRQSARDIPFIKDSECPSSQALRSACRPSELPCLPAARSLSIRLPTYLSRQPARHSGDQTCAWVCS